MSWFFSKLKYLDVTLALTFLLSLLIGLSLIYSTSLGSSRTIFFKQLLFAAAGIFLFFFFANFDFRTLIKASRYLYLFALISLTVVLKFGHAVKGSSRWFDFGFINVQPAEFTKIIVILVLARFFALRRGQINSWKNILMSFIYVFIPMLLISREPDLGSAIVICMIWLGVLFISSVRKKVFIYIVLFFAIFSIFSWAYVLRDYQKSRIESFINPSLDPKGRGYNVRQAIIAVGSGGLFGTGLGRGLQSQLRFLPERQTDFIFSSAAEELGFFGTSVILFIYFMLLYRLLVIYRISSDDMSRFVVAGIFFMMFSEIVINIGMNLGVLPVTGIPLPLLSYGGSSMFAVSVSLGIAQAVAIRSKGLKLG